MVKTFWECPEKQEEALTKEIVSGSISELQKRRLEELVWDIFSMNVVFCVRGSFVPGEYRAISRDYQGFFKSLATKITIDFKWSAEVNHANLTFRWIYAEFIKQVKGTFDVPVIWNGDVWLIDKYITKE